MTPAAVPSALPYWLNPDHLLDVFWGRLIAAALIVVAAIILAIVLRIVIGVVVDRVVRGVKHRQGVDDTRLLATPVAAARIVQRTRTLGSVLHNVANATITIIAIVLVVYVLAPGVIGSFALLTAAIGAGLGFGAQNIVKDVLNGMFIVVEDQLGVGDVVDTGYATGVVESVGIRVTQIRDVNGTVWYVRNGEMIRIGNMSQGWARVVVDVSVPYSADVDAVQDGLLAAAQKLASEAKWRGRITERPELWGIQSISGDGIVLRVVVKTRTTAKDEVARELRARLRTALAQLGVGLVGAGGVVMYPAQVTGPDAAGRGTASGETSGRADDDAHDEDIADGPAVAAAGSEPEEEQDDDEGGHA